MSRPEPQRAVVARPLGQLADVLAQALAPAQKQLRAAFVFGSMAEGREISASDIDLLLIGEIGFAEAVELLYPAQTILGREVNPKVFTPAEFSAKATAEPFLRNVLAKPKIFVIGNDDDLAELARHQS